MFFGDTTVSTSYDSLSIGNNPVYPRKKPPSSFGISKDNFVMRQVGSFYRFSIGSPTISTDGLQKIFAFFCRRSVAKSFQEAFNGTCRSIINHLHMCKTRFLFSSAIPIKRYRTQHLALPLTPSASPVTFWPKKRIIHFYQASKTVSGIAIRHCLTNLMGHQPCGFVISDFQDTLHFRYRDPYFVHGHVVDEPIPFDQRRAGFMEYRPCGQTDFWTARLAIQNISRSDKPSFCMSASWTSETIRPPHFASVLSAGFLNGKFFLKLQQAALPISFGHVSPPNNSRVHSHYELSQ